MQNKQDEKDISGLLENIKLELLSYINKRIKLVRLDSIDKGSKITTSIGYGLIVVAIVSTIIFLSFLALGFLFGELLNSLAAGFGILVAFSVVILLILLFCRKQLKSYMRNQTISFLNKLDKDDDE